LNAIRISGRKIRSVDEKRLASHDEAFRPQRPRMLYLEMRPSMPIIRITAATAAAAAEVASTTFSPHELTAFL